MGGTESKQIAPIHVDPPKILPGEERIRVSSLLDDHNKLQENDENGVDTVSKIFQTGLALSGEAPCLGTRHSKDDDYQWMTYSEVDEKATKLGSALALKVKDSNLVAIRCKNRPEWSIAAIGCSYYSYTICTINYTASYDTMKLIIQKANFKIFIAGNEEDAEWILQNHSEMPSIELIVIMDFKNEKESIRELSSKLNVEIISFNSFLDLGSDNISELNCGKPEDIFTICYTSGTTGEPKGVMLSHKALVSCVSALSPSLYSDFKNMTTISYLPVAHVFEIGVELITFKVGGKVGFYGGDIKRLMDDIQVLQPTCFPVVPRLMNRIYSEVMNEVNGSTVKKYIMDWALKSKTEALKTNGGKTIWDSILFPRIRNKLGGKVEIVVVASAPISAEVKSFVKCALDCNVFEAYGQTETTAVTITTPNDWNGGHVGYPQKNCQMKLVDVAEMNYFAKDDVGEVCVRGPSLMTGYHLRDDLTAEAIDKDGWLHSGDIGQWLPNGALKIIDRKKNIFKLSQGEYIAPEKVENVYSKCNLVSQIYVDGLSTENYCIALILPNPPTFVQWLKSNGKREKMDELLEDKEVIELFLKELHKEGKKNNLSSLEQVKKIILLSTPFTIEGGLLTATLKNKRIAIKKRFEKDIHSLYNN